MSSNYAPKVLGAYFFVLMLFYVAPLSSSAFVPRWALLSAGIPLLLWAYGRGWAITDVTALGIAFFGYAALSLCWAFNRNDAIDWLWHLALLGATFWLGASVNTRAAMLGAAAGIAVNSAICLFQPPQVTGTFLNPELMSQTAALVLVWAIFDRSWFIAIAAVPGTFLPHTRGTLVALAAVAIAWIWRKSRLAAVLLSICLIAASALYGLHRNDESTANRRAIYADTAAQLTPLGHGIGSWRSSFPFFEPHVDGVKFRFEYAHSDWLEMAYDLGLGALPLFAILVICLLGPLTAERAVVIAFLGEGCFDFPLHMPASAAVAALCGGAVCRTRPYLRDLLVRGRMRFFDWYGENRNGARPAVLARRGEDIPA